VISVNNSAAHLPLSSSTDSGSASECESGELSSDEYPSQIKHKPKSISHCQEYLLDSTHEMGTLAQLLNHSFSVHRNTSMTSHKFVSDRISYCFQYNWNVQDKIHINKCVLRGTIMNSSEHVYSCEFRLVQIVISAIICL